MGIRVGKKGRNNQPHKELSKRAPLGPKRNEASIWDDLLFPGKNGGMLKRSEGGEPAGKNVI